MIVHVLVITRRLVRGTIERSERPITRVFRHPEPARQALSAMLAEGYVGTLRAEEVLS